MGGFSARLPATKSDAFQVSPTSYNTNLSPVRIRTRTVHLGVQGHLWDPLHEH
eukprot:NODE_10222_length_342_cov_28.955631_g9311_i0.p1 GENE.NODE_10222_length_342_cov_28.955631_g9311_i0~~NODE_10222_length_342_cov_28.955631_g9311_i0.p1  ORF type:complete len:60 (+),score=9.34 NODE_10222_length_342_cov_28.955631_g9311_i0:22-180(+)